ncbi:hypothetical protein GCM10025772_05310 [Ferrimonas gelatinilytica]|uniref:Aminoglycoside phosphotransferase domain-containing protein n=1 Tax=Ferrimonas gelatinilytica TaxID=1255257 RepID=A0ABP9RWR8_9GAMM
MQRSALPHSFCHHDLHRGNLRQSESGHLVALDFEYAGLGHPLIDLVGAGHCVPDSDVLWRGYLDRRGVRADDRERQAWRAAHGLSAMMTLAWLVRIHAGELPDSPERLAPCWRPWWSWAMGVLRDLA